MMKRLTDKAVRAAKPGRYGDGNGLFLRVMPSGSKQWVQRIVIRGKRCDLGLGGYPLVTLAEARIAAFENRKIARAGGDPRALRRQLSVPTFSEAVESVIAIHRPGWKDAQKNEHQWRGEPENLCHSDIRASAGQRNRPYARHGRADPALVGKARDDAAGAPANQHRHGMGHRARLSPRRSRRRRHRCGRCPSPTVPRNIIKRYHLGRSRMPSRASAPAPPGPRSSSDSNS